jgi:hypothetical protein
MPYVGLAVGLKEGWEDAIRRISCGSERGLRGCHTISDGNCVCLVRRYQYSSVHYATGIVPYSYTCCTAHSYQYSSVQFYHYSSVFCYQHSSVHCVISIVPYTLINTVPYTVLAAHSDSHFSIPSMKKPFLALTNNYSPFIKRTLVYTLMHQLASHYACRRPYSAAISRPLRYIIGVINVGPAATRELHRQGIVTTG